MSKQPKGSEDEEQQETKEPNGPEKDETEKPPEVNRIVILEEREIPFEEERPPNFSPHYAIKVHLIQKSKHKKGADK